MRPHQKVVVIHRCHGALEDRRNVYLLVGADSTTYPQRWNPHQLANVFRVIYRLGLINRYDIVWGYSDLAGFVGTLLGASGSATGWYHSLRLWSREKWQPRSGGRQANPRYFVAPLLSSVQRETEALDVARSNLAETVFPDPNELSMLLENAPYGAADAWQQHLNAMARLHASTPRSGDVATQLQDFQTRVGTAIKLFEHLKTEGIVLSGQYPTALATLRESIDTFAELENL